MLEAAVRFRERLKAGEVCIGAGISFNDALVSDALGDSMDFLWVDLEHTAMSPDVLLGHLLAARSRKIPALVRVPGSATPFIKPVLDSGADGIIVPQVRSTDEVQRIVNDCRYPPLGQRGYGPRVPSNYDRDGGASYIERANQSVFVVAQIENREALEAIDEIVAIPGLDSVALGPQDLSASLGLTGQIEHPKVLAAIDRVIEAARKAGLWVGCGMGPNPDFALNMARRGVHWLQVGGDYSYMIKYADQITASIRSQLASQ